MRILIVEDDIQLNNTITKFLTFKNYDVKQVFNGEDALNLIENESFDLYLLDINIPTFNGLELLERIRHTDILSSVIIITASLEIDNFVKAFELGCDEYIKKPFHLKELEIRINNILQKQHDDILHVDENLYYNFSTSELYIYNNSIPLRKKLHRLLQILLKNKDRTVANGDITDYVWEGEIKEHYPLRQLIADLRKELKEYRSCIVSVSKIGYKFETPK